MLKSSLEICSQGYNVEQTDYYIANLESRLSFAENAYFDSVKRIKVLEAQNEALIRALNENLALIADKLGVDFCDEVSETAENKIQQTIAADEITQENILAAVDEVLDENNNQFASLKSQIDELKSFFENN